MNSDKLRNYELGLRGCAFVPLFTHSIWFLSLSLVCSLARHFSFSCHFSSRHSSCVYSSPLRALPTSFLSPCSLPVPSEPLPLSSQLVLPVEDPLSLVCEQELLWLLTLDASLMGWATEIGSRLSTRTWACCSRLTWTSMALASATWLLKSLLFMLE